MKIPKRLKRLSIADTGTLAERALKLSEESGEVAEAVLTLVGRKNSNKRLKVLEDHVVEEVIDTTIMCMDILVQLEYTNERKIKKLITRKLKKWENATK